MATPTSGMDVGVTGGDSYIQVATPTSGMDVVVATLM